MTYSVHIGSGGYLGWKILARTMTTQRNAFVQSSAMETARDYFARKMPEVVTAESFVNDRKLLTVALRAFGLDADINSRYFIRKVLEADPEDKSSLVNRLADKRYLNLNRAFSAYFSSATEALDVDLSEILERYNSRSFEKNIGEQYAEIELALNAQRELREIARADISENAKWYQILASKPLRQIFEGAYGLRGGFSALPVDRQLSELKTKTAKLTGSDGVSQFSSGQALESILRRYLLRSQMEASPATSGYSVALALLTSRPP
ncbi:MAG: DUF1217 domain-containing protein [Paracoccus sp. BP8]|nr:MAG: DUF1217 domain-containing protein [Paracoccus sp. BP8]